ncbi:hypothetical protein AX15_004731 [Amanita polypyramis BW_CC]|nr:hypothetical protein AX15_004731 [Amanita polypyramis BW_CC]
MRLHLESIILTFPFLLAVTAAPVSTTNSTSLADKATLLANGKAAQRLNAQFQSLKATDPCTNGEKVCVSNSIAHCANGKWQIEGKCPKTEQCFALPSLTSNGTTTTCTSQKTAESLFDAIGVPGGATGFNSATSNDRPATGSGEDQPTNSMNGTGTHSQVPTSSSTTLAAGGADEDAGQKTVTVAVTAIPTHFVQTTTISPQEASQLLSSFPAVPTHRERMHHHHHLCHHNMTVTHDSVLTTPTASSAAY